MRALLIFFVELCALRRAPQDLPASAILLWLMLFADLFAGLLVGMTAGISLWASLLQGIVEIALMLAALTVALQLMKRPGRFLQAGTALLGSGALLGLLALMPLSLHPTGSQETNLAALGAFLLLGLVIWGVVVTGHILRHTFGLTLGQGAAIAIAFEIAAITLVTGLFGGA
ncbi:hypothetical protein [uncultured Thiocystis sp.]|uniref:hypothetical protein n=1 Tax=uncultured Thiocystis sp. TaxID=1202134 RepID=UPI0025DC534A|nr:hypothetical protein [uncultured Thiocystis sp.]